MKLNLEVPSDARTQCPKGNPRNPSTLRDREESSSKYLEIFKNAREIQIQGFSGVSGVEEILPSRFCENIMVGRWESPLGRNWMRDGGVRVKRKRKR